MEWRRLRWRPSNGTFVICVWECALDSGGAAAPGTQRSGADPSLSVSASASWSMGVDGYGRGRRLEVFGASCSRFRSCRNGRHIGLRFYRTARGLRWRPLFRVCVLSFAIADVTMNSTAACICILASGCTPRVHAAHPDAHYLHAGNTRGRMWAHTANL